MTAVRNLTDADVEAIADALERRGLVKRRAANEAPEPMTADRRADIARRVRRNAKRLGVGSSSGG